MWYIIRPGFEKREKKIFLELLLKGILEIGVPLKRLEFGSICLEREKGGNLIILQ